MTKAVANVAEVHAAHNVHSTSGRDERYILNWCCIVSNIMF